MNDPVREFAKKFALKEIRPFWEKLDAPDPAFLKTIIKKADEAGILNLPEQGLEKETVVHSLTFVEEVSRACAGAGLLFASHFMGITSGSGINAPSVPGLLFSFIPPDKTSEITLTKNGNTILLSGEIKNVCCPSIADMFIVCAETKGETGLVSFSIPSKTEGIRCMEEKPRLGLAVLPVQDVVFENAVIPKELMVQEVSFFNGFHEACLASVALGMGKEAFEIAMNYAIQRYQGGRRICEHDAVKMLLSQMSLSIEIIDALIEKTINNAGQKTPSFCSAYAADAAEKVCLDAVQILGGYGYMRDFRVERILRDAKTFQSCVAPIQQKMRCIDFQINQRRNYTHDRII